MEDKWHEIDPLGKIISKQFRKVNRLSGKNQDLTENISVLHALSQAAHAISTLKTANIVSTKIDKIEKLLSYIPQEVMQEALTKINERK